MSGANNGQQKYRVVLSGKFKAEIRSLLKRAKASGLSVSFSAAWREIEHDLETHPEKFGDPYKKLHAIGLLLCHRAIRPIYIVFGIDAVRKLVYIQSVRPFPADSY